MTRDPALDAIAASALASAAILASLVAELQRKGALNDGEVRAIYETSLSMLTEMRNAGGDALAPVIDEARRVIEDQL